MSTTLGAARTVRLNDIGVVFTVTILEPDPTDPTSLIVKDISAATVLEIILQKPNPDLTKITKTAVFVTDGTDGKITFTSIAGDLDIAGRWSLEGEVTLPTGKFRSDRERFDVEEIIE